MAADGKYARNQRRFAMLRRSVLSVVVAVSTAGGGALAAETVELEPAADATLYEEGADVANGSGDYFFVGRTEDRNGAVERRALVMFDLSGSVPDGATITAASLELTMSRTISGSQTVTLRRVLESWSEGPSDAPGEEGAGTGSGNGDVTWIHRSLPNSLWSTEGGTFTQDVSSSQQVAGNGAYVFPSTAQMIADVQGWLDDPQTNFGWAIVIPGPVTGSAKRFNSRENPGANSRPVLSVTYEADEEPELTERYVFPASNAGGSGDSFFITTADIANDGPTTASFRIELLLRNTDNSDALQSALFTLEPGHVRRFDNVLAEAFGSDGDNVAGGAAVVSDSDRLVVMTRTFNQVEEGTIGAALPGISNSELIQAGERVKIIFLSENDDFRSNLGLLNGVDSTTRVEWELFSSDGTSLETGARNLPPYGVTQINRVLRPYRPIEAAYAEVWTDTTGGAFTTYGSILDEGTSDPTLVTPR
jgi:hypothetical protein